MLMKKLFTLFAMLAIMSLTSTTQAQITKKIAPTWKENSAKRMEAKPMKAAKRAKAANGEVTDENGMILSPAEGTRKLYKRSGTGYYLSNEEMMAEEQTGVVETVECADGTIYIKDILSYFSPGLWVKGTKNGSTITVPTRQPMYFSEDYGATISLRWGQLDAESSPVAADSHGEAFTFTISGDVITLEGSSTGPLSYFMGLFWDDDNAATGYGDAETVWTTLSVTEKVDELPYYNDFETDEQRYSFTFIDANNDGTTWAHIYNTDDEHYLRYQYSSTNDADDWAVSPAIKLEAGKLYRVAFDTRCAMPTERIEMKMGTEASAEALTTVVIDPTDVEWEENKTLENRHVTVEQTGYYYFGIHAISISDVYRLYADNFAVEEIETEAPAAVDDLKAVAVEDKLEADISFTAPSKKISGEDLGSNLTKIELLRDGEVIKTFEDVAPGTAITYHDDSSDLTLGNHTYQVIAYNDKGMGEKSEVVSVFLSAILEVPYTADLTNENTFNTFTVIDANEDESTWGWEQGYWTTYTYNSDNQGDDYLILPRLHLVGGKNYYVVVNALTSGYTERFEVKIGKEATAEGLATQIMEPQDVTDYSNEGTFYESMFSVPEDGDYYIAVHAISDADMDHLTLNSISIDFGPEPKAPAAPEIEVAADSQGELTANIKVTAPTSTVDGSTLSEITKIDILRDGEIVGTLNNVAPGAESNYTDTPEEAGYHTYQAIPYNAEGFGIKSEKQTAYIGVDVPLAVENFTATDNATNVVFNWNKVGEVGANELYVNPSKVDYIIYGTEWVEGWLGPELSYTDELKIDSLRDADTYTLEFNTEEGEQNYVYWVIEPKNDAGTGANTVTGLLAGAPYSTPLTESFTDTEFHYFWDTDCEPMGFSLASDDDESAVALLATQSGEKYFDSGKINLKDVSDPVMMLDLMAMGITKITVKGSVDGGEMTTIMEDIPVTEEYTTVTVPLDALKNGRYARLSIIAEFTNISEFDFFTGELVTTGDVLVLDNIRIGSNSAFDGIRNIDTNSEKSGNIYSINGQMLHKGAHSIKGMKGIYVVDGKKVATH